MPVSLKKIAAIFFTFFSCFVQYTSMGQKFHLFTHIDGNAAPGHQSFDNLEEAQLTARNFIPQLHAQGYITASVDSAGLSDSSISLFIFQGKQYKWHKISFKNLPEPMMEVINSRFGPHEGGAYAPGKIKEITDYILGYADETGYPFAQVYFEEVQIDEEQQVSATLIYDPGSDYIIDSIRVHFDGRLNNSFFYNYLDIYDGMPYTARKMRTLSPLIASLPYLEEEKSWQLNFGVNENTLDLYLKERKANQANAILGIQPSADQDKRFDITADVLLFFQNEFGYGERLKFSYQQLQQNSPRMNASLNWPYLFGTKFGVEGNFEYQRFDTTFRKTTGNAGIIYQLNANDFVKVYSEIQSNRTITFDTAFVKNNKRLPPNIDVTSTGGGLQVMINRLNNNLNPVKGLMVSTSIAGAKRTILVNNAIDLISDATGFDYLSLYDTVNHQQFQMKLKTSLSYFLPVWKTLTIRMGYENGYISGSGLFRNELYQIGGFKLLRGFNELSIFSNHYHIGTIEPRLLMGPLSHIYLFSDFGYVATLDFNNMPSQFNVLSFGVGGTLSTESGIFNVAFGLGRQGNESLNFRDTRVHFGYAVYF